MNRLRTMFLRAPVLGALAIAAAAAAIGWFLRYVLVEPEALGTLCRAAGAPIWCWPRTGLIVATQFNGFGLAGIALAAASFVARGRVAWGLVIAAMILGGAGLYLYNTTMASGAVLLALLRAARLDQEPPKA